MDLGLLVAAIVALGGALFALLALPSRPTVEEDEAAQAPPVYSQPSMSEG
jgi:hypothetical protein